MPNFLSNLDSQKKASLQGLGKNFATQNKFIMYIPIQDVLGPKYGNLELNIQQFSLPEMVIDSSSVAFHGYQVAVSSRTLNANTKTVTINYLMDEHWENYLALMEWAGLISTATIYPVSANTGSTKTIPEEYANIKPEDLLLTCRVSLLNSYKKPIMDIVYEDCWVSSFSELALDVAQPNEITHSVTFSYSSFHIIPAR